MNQKSKKSVALPDCTLSEDIIKLYKSAAVKNVNEAITVLFHAFLLETGLSPKDVSNEDKYQYMPDNWNTNGIFKIRYSHYCCAAFTCCVTCVPLYNNVSVHGIICDTHSPNSVHYKLNGKNYLKQKKDFSNVFQVFSNLEELARHFKDNFCLPLLNLLHETAGKQPLFGMSGLIDELKLNILEILPVEGVVSMSAVNKSFNYLANSSFLWKHLFQRDFVNKFILYEQKLLKVCDSDKENNWKEIYKKEYHIKKTKAELRSRLLLPVHHPLQQEFFPVGPDFDTDIGINFDPPFPESHLPFLQPRFPPSFFRRLF